MAAKNSSHFIKMQLLFKDILGGKNPIDEEVIEFKQWIRDYKTPVESICDPKLSDLEEVHGKSIVTYASQRFVELEKEGFLLGKVPKFEFSEKSFPHSLIFDGERQNKFKLSLETDGYELDNGVEFVSAKGYKMKSKGTGLISCTPGELNSTEKFTDLATDAETRSDLPHYNSDIDCAEYVREFFNVFLVNREINNVPYLILNLPGLADIKKRNVPRLSEFLFKDIKNLLETLDYGKYDGFKHPYVYFYFNLSVAGLHDEEYSMNSFNVNYGPGLKIWFVFPRTDSHKLRDLYVQLENNPFFSEFAKIMPICQLQHKDVKNSQKLINPALLALAGISYKMVIQRPGCAILTSSAAMHAVINISRGVSVAQNLLIPINYCMNPIQDMCTHYKESFEEMVQIKIRALVHIARNPPLLVDPDFKAFHDVPIKSACRTGEYIEKLIKVFQHLKYKGNNSQPCKPHDKCEFCSKGGILYKQREVQEIGLKYAYFALKRLIRLAGLSLDIVYYNSNTTNVTTIANDTPAGTSDDAGNADDIDDITDDIDDIDKAGNLEKVPESSAKKFVCPVNLHRFHTLPVLISEFDSYGELSYSEGKVVSAEGTTIAVRKHDGSTVSINISEPDEICKAVMDKEPAESDLSINDQVLFSFKHIFCVGRLHGFSVDPQTNEKLYSVEMPGMHARILCSKNILRILKPYWFDELLVLNLDGVPLTLPKYSENRVSRKRPAHELDRDINSEQLPKRMKYTKGEQLRYEVVDGKLMCPRCEKSFKKKQAISDHFYKEHAEGYPGYTCAGCGAHFLNLGDYNKHNITDHGGNQEKLKPIIKLARGNFIKITF